MDRQNEPILLMIFDGGKRYHLVVKGLSALLNWVTFKHNKDLYCLQCFHLFTTKNKLKSQTKVCQEPMSDEDTKNIKGTK